MEAPGEIPTHTKNGPEGTQYTEVAEVSRKEQVVKQQTGGLPY